MKLLSDKTPDDRRDDRPTPDGGRAASRRREDLPRELRMKRQEAKALRYPMERCGAIVSRSLHVTGGEDEPHVSEIARWDQVYPDGTDRDPSEALKDLIAVGVRAAVIAPEHELPRWFSWLWYWTDSLVDDLVREGRACRVNGHVTAPP